VTKDILLASRRLDRDTMLDKAAAGFASCVTGDEGREGIAAFLEKRRPAWAEVEANDAQ
jgi:isohexenylglutaconyl-CoA hydratase